MRCLTNPPVTRFLRSQTGAVLLWIAAALVLAAVLAPWLYGAGKELATVTAEREMAGFWEWLGAACGRAKFGRFFNRALLLSALVLLPFLLLRVRRLSVAGGASHAPLLGATLAESWPRRAALWALGLAAAAVLLWGLGWLLAWAGAFGPKAEVPSAGKLLGRALWPALGASVGEELIFRGVLLGLWLRVARPLTACAGSSLVFAVLHFLQPAPGDVLADPRAPWAGFQLLGSMIWHFTEPRFFVADFLTLFVLGLALAHARLRSGSLWLPMGMHCGWVLVFKLFHGQHFRIADGPIPPLLVGDNLRSGILPLAVIVLTTLVCHLALKVGEQQREAPETFQGGREMPD